MIAVSLTVNGETHNIQTEPRSQLAEILRDYLRLTGTHLGCEQGVCGACTVLMDGKPVRSCLTYAGSCEDTDIQTIEGFADDAVMADLRTAFSRHHALQCGFCTPGMLITAHDIVLRGQQRDPAEIRMALSGNLCRCTGYVGLVGAIQDVVELHAKAPAAQPAPQVQGFTPFEPSDQWVTQATTQGTASGLSVRDGWTVVQRTWPLSFPRAAVWDLFEDLEQVCQCIPGVALGERAGANFSGTFAVKFGPIRTTFSGNGARRSDVASQSGAITGKGQESNGQSKIQGELNYQLHDNGDQTTTITLELRYQIQGLLAQFNRADLIESFIDLLLRQFMTNCERHLGGEGLQPQQSLNFFRFLWDLIKIKWLRQ